MFLDSQAHSFPFFGFLLGYKLVKPHALEKLVSKRERIKKKKTEKEERWKKGRKRDRARGKNSCLENPRDGGAWWAAGYGVAQSRTRLSDFTFRRKKPKKPW